MHAREIQSFDNFDFKGLIKELPIVPELESVGYFDRHSTGNTETISTTIKDVLKREAEVHRRAFGLVDCSVSPEEASFVFSMWYTARGIYTSAVYKVIRTSEDEFHFYAGTPP